LHCYNKVTKYMDFLQQFFFNFCGTRGSDPLNFIKLLWICSIKCHHKNVILSEIWIFIIFNGCVLWNDDYQKWILDWRKREESDKGVYIIPSEGLEEEGPFPFRPLGKVWKEKQGAHLTKGVDSDISLLGVRTINPSGLLYNRGMHPLSPLPPLLEIWLQIGSKDLPPPHREKFTYTTHLVCPFMSHEILS
jgi:hypothetical protein